MKALLTGFLLAALAWLPGTAAAADAPVSGRDYVEIPGGMPWAPKAGTIEVAEVFGYSCPHCAHLEPQLQAWKAQQKHDVNFVAIPAAFGGAWNGWARAYFAAYNLGLVPRTHEAVFKAVHETGMLPRNPSAQELAAFYAGHGTSADGFRAAMAEPKVEEQMRRAAAFARASGLEGTPTLIVDGRYRVLGHDFAEMLRITDWLVARERQAQARP
ncbi:thiol:disulfide interchange protein DsbA/DsbL [Pseudoxanthomonas koreensis]|uniref:thiol:disulfide interchange protein DsbA/DsbL n=1 Tax=Pseudoxanthomonas koreensis TaxID=266061 RepID=UPI001391F4CD|nr:thiol:disulfide interchange protein DsbA/DsbL [Pseudoxanthomonas koreensis]KAF1694905.1 hypothetical protein CSC64_03490 [Pseudoxanthomonas koreensis]